ncbi:transcriptional regulator, TraR/DksA family [Salinihabitans flavidus]|uniref:Transcriptional regulator, TraR/DksA family n=1 Tax=Salinihabitans flavidus TaxID=569882 RepID=A0A1H8Q9R3_9RHOB|nr:TraR/DksA C4-type zinc finger protein [Salinihabitans flavidus]SEO50955.1 transcriptional regulator, TraR/DksA family [Salinihabitans flavidus]
MNDEELARFRALIESRLRELEQENARGETGQSVVTLDQQSVGRLSRMDALQNQAMAKAQQVRRDTEAKGLRTAFLRIEEGEFGYCIECGEEIARKRLEFDPAATRCISCASG